MLTTKLFSTYQIKDVTLKNRIVMSPMCMYSAKNDGKITNWHTIHYLSRAVGQVGLIMVEATAVTAQGRISAHDLGIWDDQHIEGLQSLVEDVHAEGAKIGIQLAHAGRKATVDGPIFAPSAIPFNEDIKRPEELTIEEIEEAITAFQAGAKRAKEAGFDIIEIHGAHGYLINEFLSPLTNKRVDSYGGNLDNRYRFLKETIDAVKQVWDGPLFVRLSANEYHQDGNSIDTFIDYAKRMKEQGVDLIDCSSGGVIPAKVQTYPGYQTQYAEQIKHGADTATGAVGLITSGIQAEEALQNNRADLIFIARELLRDPYWPRTAAKILDTSIDAPKQYERGWV